MTAQFNYDKTFAPNSSWIDGVYYNTGTGGLAVVAEGRHYFYSNVPQAVYNRGANAESTGGWYNSEVRGAYSTPVEFKNVRPGDPVTYVEVGTNPYAYDPNAYDPNRGSVSVSTWPLHQNTNPDALDYRILADVKVDYKVTAASIEEAIAEFKNNIAKYVTVNVKGVQLIDS